MGFNLGFEQPSSQVVARALRHAILPKHYGSEYNLHFDWPTFGIPEHLCIYGGSNTNFDYLQVKASQLGIVLHQGLEVRQAGIVERCFFKFSQELFSCLPGYVEQDLRARPEAMANQVCLTLEELEKLLVRYIVGNYNQQIHPGLTNQTRQQRWEGGLVSPPLLLQEQELDI